MLLSDFHRLRFAAEDCSSLDEYIAEEGGSLSEERRKSNEICNEILKLQNI